MTRVGLSSIETLLLHWEDCQDHPWVPASYTSVPRTLKSLLIISVRSVDILRAHIDESRGITIVETVSPHILRIWPTSGPPLKGVTDLQNSFLLGTAFSVEPISLRGLVLLLLLWKQVSFAGSKIARRRKRNLSGFQMGSTECDQQSREPDIMPRRIYQCLSLEKVAHDNTDSWQLGSAMSIAVTAL